MTRGIIFDSVTLLKYMKILVTGGAGYVGSALIPALLQNGHEVKALDNLMYGGESLLQCFFHKNFSFYKGDIRDENLMRSLLQHVDVIIHLAAITGYPACKKNEKLAHEVNFLGTQNIGKNLHPDQIIFFASTGSNYGALLGASCTEDTPLAPLTTYGVTKTLAEKFLLDNCNTVAYRFATGYGVSPRLRLDLLVHDLVYQALRTKNLVIYEKEFKRTFIHVRDMANAFLFGLKNIALTKNQVFNVGSETMNFTKEELVKKIRERLSFYVHFAEVGKDEDQRNYEVSYKKFADKGFQTTIAFEDGLDEVIGALRLVDVKNPYSNSL